MSTTWDEDLLLTRPKFRLVESEPEVEETVTEAKTNSDAAALGGDLAASNRSAASNSVAERDENKSKLQEILAETPYRPDLFRRIASLFVDNTMMAAVSALIVFVVFALGNLFVPGAHFYPIIFSCLYGLGMVVAPWLSLVMAVTSGILASCVSASTHNPILGTVFWIVMTINALVNLIYHTHMTSKFGRTFGQKLMGIRVVTKDGKNLSMQQAFFRSAMKLGIFSFASLCLWVPFLQMGSLSVLLLFAASAFGALWYFNKSAATGKLRQLAETAWRKPTGSITLADKGGPIAVMAMDEQEVSIKESEVEKTRLITSKDELLVRFKPYAAVSRWFEHRMAQTNMWTSLAIVTASFMAFAVVASWLGEFIKPLIFTLLNGDTGKAISAIMTGGTAAGGPLVMLGLIFAVLLGIGVSGLLFFLIRLYLKPTHIRFNSSGIAWTRFDTLRKCYVDIKTYEWKNLSHVRLERKSGNALNTEPKLIFIWNGHEETQLELSSIPTLEEKATILTAIDRWNKDVPVESEVITSLAISPEHSYTEVWMQALCAPPKRERLKPLVNGTALREGQYTVQKQLGAGGQGVAYLATDSITSKEVVLKEMLLPVFVDMTVRKQALDRFEGECRILRSLDHEQIVKLSNFFVEDHRAYLVLEYIDGRNLKQEINSGRKFSSEEIKSLALDMCNILEYLHSRTPAVVHRDFTPDNLMLTSDGRLKLIDFNVANQQEETATGTVVGKQSYMPLEQFQGDPSPVSDIYALGATLFYLSTGKDPEPLSTSHPLSEASKLKDNEPILENFDQLVAKCTEVNHKRRYQSIEELRQALEEL